MNFLPGFLKRLAGRKKNSKSQGNLLGEIEEWMEGFIITMVISLFVLFALFGNNIRIIASEKSSDHIYYALYFVCFIIFSAEIIIYTVVTKGYAFSFIFWLEIVAAISLIPDIEWLMIPIQKLFGLTTKSEALNVSASESAISSAVSDSLYTILISFRFVKLLRIVKLYKFCVRASVDDDDEQEGEQPNNSEQQKALKTELDPVELGKTLTNRSTQKIMIGILLMYIMYPILLSSYSHDSFKSGLKMLFRAGSSSCTDTANPFCNSNVITIMGWHCLLQTFVDSGKLGDSDDYTFEVLWLYCPDYSSGGKIMSIPKVYYMDFSSTYWAPHESCAGKEVPDELLV